jgi:hypothetical protein
LEGKIFGGVGDRGSTLSSSRSDSGSSPKAARRVFIVSEWRNRGRVETIQAEVSPASLGLLVLVLVIWGRWDAGDGAVIQPVGLRGRVECGGTTRRSLSLSVLAGLALRSTGGSVPALPLLGLLGLLGPSGRSACISIDAGECVCVFDYYEGK